MFVVVVVVVVGHNVLLTLRSSVIFQQQ